MFSTDRDTYRRVFVEAWRKHRANEPLEPLESRIVSVIARHPEFQSLLEDAEPPLNRDFGPDNGPDNGNANPFFHVGLHLAILEQVSIDQPAGIRRLYAQLVERLGDPHQAEHRMMSCLAESLWKLQQGQATFSERDYLACIERR